MSYTIECLTKAYLFSFYLKFIYSEKAEQFEKESTYQICMAFSEYMNFNSYFFSKNRELMNFSMN